MDNWNEQNEKDAYFNKQIKEGKFDEREYVSEMLIEHFEKDSNLQDKSKDIEDIFNEDDLMEDILEREFEKKMDPDYYSKNLNHYQDLDSDHDKDILEKEVIEPEILENNLEISQYIDYLNGSDDTLDHSQAVTFLVNYDDGTQKEIVIDPNSKLIQANLDTLQNESLDEIKKTLINDLNKIDSIEIKNGDKYHKKIKIKDFVNKELNTINHSSNPEKLGEDIIIAILKPLKIYNNYLGQIRQEKEQKAEKIEKPKFTIEVDKKEYLFKNYSEDFKKIFVTDQSGKLLEIENNKNFKFLVSPSKEMNNVELDLLSKGKELIHKDKLPFKIKKDEIGKIQFSTITENEFITNLSEKEKVTLNKKIEKTTNYGV